MMGALAALLVFGTYGVITFGRRPPRVVTLLDATAPPAAAASAPSVAAVAPTASAAPPSSASAFAAPSATPPPLATASAKPPARTPGRGTKPRPPGCDPP